MMYLLLTTLAVACAGEPDRHASPNSTASPASPALPASSSPEIGAFMSNLASGYNVFEGNPLRTGDDHDDPGLKNAIFNFSYNDYKNGNPKKLSDDDMWIVPDKYQMHNTDSCTQETSETTYTGMTKYQNDLKVAIEVEKYEVKQHESWKDRWDANSTRKSMFKASAAYKRMKQGTTSEESLYISTHAQCSVYKVFLPSKLAKKIPLDNSFRDALVALKDVKYDPNNKYSQQRYFEIITDYGTHYFGEAMLGSYFGYMREMKRSKYSELLTQGK